MANENKKKGIRVVLGSNIKRESALLGLNGEIIEETDGPAAQLVKKHYGRRK